MTNLRRVSQHEAGHAVASWYFTGEILGVTLGSDLATSGSVWSGCYNTNTLIAPGSKRSAWRRCGSLRRAGIRR